MSGSRKAVVEKTPAVLSPPKTTVERRYVRQINVAMDKEQVSKMTT